MKKKLSLFSRIFSISAIITLLVPLWLPIMAQCKSLSMDESRGITETSILKAEEIMGIEFDKSDISTENFDLSGCVFTELTDRNDVKITLDQEGNIVRFNTIYAEKDNKSNDKIEVKGNISTNNEKILNLFSLDQSYEMSKQENYGEYYGYSYIKEYSNGLQNPFDSVKVLFDAATNSIVIATKFKHEPNSIVANITIDEAIDSAERSEYYALGSTVTDWKLTYILPSMFENDKVKRYSNENEAVLCYKIVYDDGCIIYVDAMDAEPVAVDEIMAINSASFTIHEVSASTHPNAYNRRPSSVATCKELNGYRDENILLSERGFRKLGYNAVGQNNPYTDNTINTDMSSFISGDNSYGFYFCGHASPDVLAYKYHTILRRENVSGNWRFVFLDGCETAVDTGWATQFNIYGKKGRAYLGWFDTVELVNTHKFQKYFWPRVGTKEIQALALDAANAVSGAGTTPIRFWGDSSYTGVEK